MRCPVQCVLKTLKHKLTGAMMAMVISGATVKFPELLKHGKLAVHESHSCVLLLLIPVVQPLKYR
jgi:hypothetical protein